MKTKQTLAIARGLVLAALVFGFATNVSAQPNNPPNPPNPQAPANGATNVSLQVFIRWTGAADPDGDTVEFDLYFGTVSPPPLFGTEIPVGLVLSAPLQVATTYYWRVVARDEHGAETTGPEWSFTTKPTNSPPVAPSSPSPPNNYTLGLVTASLSWTGDDPDGIDEIYDVYFGTVNPPPFVGTVTEERYYYNGLPFTTTFYWRIEARDPHGAATSGPTWTFTTKANSAPAVPSNPQPSNSDIASSSPVLTWTAGDIDVQPLTYDLYLGTTSPPPLVATGLTSPSFEPSPLQPGVTYYWSVTASDGALSTSGPIWSFDARQPGDVVQDNQLTVDDAACALEIYLWNPACGGASAYLLADADCSGNVTPADARCIHREAVSLGCDICDGAIAAAPGEESALSPSVSLSNWFIDANTLIVRLAVSGSSAFSAFGFYATASPSITMLQANRRGATSTFDILEGRQVSATYAYIGAYSLASNSVGADAEFVELRFDVSGGIPNNLVLDGFVDDLAGAAPLLLPFDSMVGVNDVPSHLALHQNYPNPFNPQTTIAYDVPASATPERVQLRIVDVVGRAVRTLVDEGQVAGSYRATWEGKDDRGVDVSSGIYFYVLDVGGARQSRKMVLLK